MCGICGIISSDRQSLGEKINIMRDRVAYRGPDGKGAWLSVENGIALGHRRLSILDLTDNGAQPMTYSNDNLVITFNGEIYNYIEIRSDLVKYGYQFRSGTDTEVILAAYDKWGEKCLEKFNGMFAFAIWDQLLKRMFLARDRIGIKPLYYYKDENTFMFASEIKSITAILKTKKGLNSHLVDYYMSYGYIPGEDSLHKGIKRLLPGHFAYHRNNNLTISRYWDYSFDNSKDHGLKYYTNGLQELVNSSIRLRLRSDVPVGVFLSGGIDSSAVVALLSSQIKEPVKTFSVAYDFGGKYNETNFARMVAKRYNTDHHEYFMTPKDFSDFVPDYVDYMDEPVTESAAISLYYIAKKAKEHVTVILSGEGSDEIFAGYDFYYYNQVIERIRPFLKYRSLNTILNHAVNAFPDNKIKKYMEMCFKSLPERYKGISTYDESIKEALYTDEFRQRLRINKNKSVKGFIHNLFGKTKTNDALSRMLYCDTKTWLVDDLLIKADRMSMAPSLELRVPFLDHRIVEFSAKMPSKYKLNGRQNKYILKNLMQEKLPREIINRKKMGFPTPLKLMFQKDLFGYAHDILNNENLKIQQFFNKDIVNTILTEHVSRKKDNHRVIWQLIVLETWMQKNI